jgi:hypothetical protein
MVHSRSRALDFLPQQELLVALKFDFSESMRDRLCSEWRTVIVGFKFGPDSGASSQGPSLAGAPDQPMTTRGGQPPVHLTMT